ncbi:MAG: CNNM domain-containing protein [Candidatus Thermoplasmatota archaeon]|nr:CNNM domain-containing protein [Candidatus Thermoplasmatota archaeon]
MTDYTLMIAYAVLALGASFLCSILEAVLLSTSHGHIVALKDTHKKVSTTWSSWKEDPERPLTAILTLNTIAHTVGALGVGSEVENNFEGQYVVAGSAAVLTIAILLLSEILPKTIGALYWRQLTVPTYHFLRWMMWTLWPIVVIIEMMRAPFPQVETETVTRNELSVLADIAEESDVIEEDEEAVIQNLLKLREIKVAEVMTPRVVMTTVDSNETVREVMDRIPIMIHGRMPVSRENVDDVIGLVLRSEILRRAADDDFDVTMEELSRDTITCSVDTSVDKALDILLENKEQLLVAKDQFGGTAGLVTMEDIIETLLGVEIVDESDQDAIDDGVLHEDMRELAKRRLDSESE